MLKLAIMSVSSGVSWSLWRSGGSCLEMSSLAGYCCLCTNDVASIVVLFSQAVCISTRGGIQGCSVRRLIVRGVLEIHQRIVAVAAGVLQSIAAFP